MAEYLTLPATTSENLEAPLTAWSPDVDDPASLDWFAVVSVDHARQGGPAPENSDPAWVVTELVDRGVGSKHDYRVIVPLEGLEAGTYGVWVRASGGPFASPVRWAGQVRLK